MTAITCTYGRGWHPVRDTSNPSRDPLSYGFTSFSALNWQRHNSLRGRPLAKLAAAERRIANPAPRLVADAERDARAALSNHAFVMGHFERLLGAAA